MDVNSTNLKFYLLWVPCFICIPNFYGELLQILLLMFAVSSAIKPLSQQPRNTDGRLLNAVGNWLFNIFGLKCSLKWIVIYGKTKLMYNRASTELRIARNYVLLKSLHIITAMFEWWKLLRISCNVTELCDMVKSRMHHVCDAFRLKSLCME
jgi:hypothetical protein